MKLPGELIEARVVRRVNRFLAQLDVAGAQAPAHVPNSGRLGELLYPGARVLVAPRAGRRKTRFDLLLAWHGRQLVSIDARLPGLLLEEALQAGRLPGLGTCTAVRREVPFGTSRLDLLVDGPCGPCYVEAKSVTLVRAGVGLFPDAPTRRGVRHLQELVRAAEAGYGAAIAFVVQREDAEALRPHEEADPVFAAALRAAAPHVRLLAYRCKVRRGEVRIARPIPVLLSSHPAG